MRAPVCFLELHLLRLWEPGPPNTAKKTLWEPCQGAGAAKFGFCQLWRKLHWWRSASLKGKLSLQNECPSWNRTTDGRNMSSSSVWSFPSSQADPSRQRGVLKDWNLELFPHGTEIKWDPATMIWSWVSSSLCDFSLLIRLILHIPTWKSRFFILGYE